MIYYPHVVVLPQKEDQEILWFDAVLLDLPLETVWMEYQEGLWVMDEFLAEVNNFNVVKS